MLRWYEAEPPLIRAEGKVPERLKKRRERERERKR